MHLALAADDKVSGTGRPSRPRQGLWPRSSQPAKAMHLALAGDDKDSGTSLRRQWHFSATISLGHAHFHHCVTVRDSLCALLWRARFQTHVSVRKHNNVRTGVVFVHLGVAVYAPCCQLWCDSDVGYYDNCVKT